MTATQILVCDLAPNTAYGSASSTAYGSLKLSAFAGTSVNLNPGAALPPPPPATDYRMLYEAAIAQRDAAQARIDAFSAALKALIGNP